MSDLLAAKNELIKNLDRLISVSEGLTMRSDLPDEVALAHAIANLINARALLVKTLGAEPPTVTAANEKLRGASDD